MQASIRLPRDREALNAASAKLLPAVGPTWAAAGQQLQRLVEQNAPVRASPPLPAACGW
jgi:hypothetical protein